MPSSSPSFAKVADAYEAYRLGYTGLVWDHLAHSCGLVPGADVVDLGCGTGLSSLPLIERGANVIGIEPDAEMLARAEGHWAIARASSAVAPRSFRCPTRRSTSSSRRRPRTGSRNRTPETRSCACCGRRPRRVRLEVPDARDAVHLPRRRDRDAAHGPLAAGGAIYGIGTVSQLLRPGLEGYSRVTFEQPIAYTVERYVGHVSSRERVLQLLGPQIDALLSELSERISLLEPSGAFIEQNLAYVVSARRSA